MTTQILTANERALSAYLIAHDDVEVAAAVAAFDADPTPATRRAVVVLLRSRAASNDFRVAIVDDLHTSITALSQGYRSSELDPIAATAHAARAAGCHMAPTPDTILALSGPDHARPDFSQRFALVQERVDRMRAHRSGAWTDADLSQVGPAA
jgi:hypothetical protein